MDNDLKKVGLVFKADGTTDFVKSLHTLNSCLSENYSKFKLVQTGWDDSTKTSTKLKEKLEYLNNAYDIQSDKVNLLTKELNELESAEERNEQAIQKKKTQLNQAEAKLNQYKTRIKETTIELQNSVSNLKIFGDKLGDVSDKLEKAADKTKKFSLISTGALTASLKTAIDFDDAFAGVTKTVDATDEELSQLKKGIRDMAKELPATTTEICEVAEAAGQLGISSENILSFSRTMIDLGETTNLSATEAADSLARFANITGMSQKDFDKLGSTIVDLGNNCATTEAEIVNMGLRLAGAGTTVGMTEDEILSFAAALSSVGIEAEAGGSAFSKMMINIESAVSTNSKDLQKYADIVGMTADEFKEAWEKDATNAMTKFIKGLGNVEKKGGNLINTLDDLGISEVRLRDTMLRAANASDLFSDTVKRGSKAWNDNNALSNEAAKRYETLKSKMDIALNKIKDMAISLGEKLMPSIEKIIDKVGKWIDKFNGLNDSQVDLIVNVGLVIAALSPLLTMIGKVTSVAEKSVKGIETFIDAWKVSRGSMESTEKSVNNLSKVIQGIESPIGLTCLAIGASFALIKKASDDSLKVVKEDFATMGTAASDFYNGIQTAESHLSDFNSTLFASNEEQQQLQQNMNDIQNGITQITKKASDERREYTQEEIKKLDEYFEQLRALKDRELEIQTQIAVAITQQAQTVSESHKGSLEEYKTVSQEWIKTAQDQAQAEIALINNRTIEEIALLNVRYGEKATLENEEYKREYDTIMAKKEQAIATANEEVAKVNQTYFDGYTKRLFKDEEFYNKFTEVQKKLEEAKTHHAEMIENIDNGELYGHMSKKAALIDAETSYKNKAKKIWKELYKEMDESQADQLGVWLGMASNTELYGGQITDKSKKIVDTILESYDSMPKKTRETMKNAMIPMIEEMEKKEPSLYAKASGIANGILGRLKKSFDIHSPSRKMRAIFQNVMKGAEVGVEDEEKSLYNQTEKIADRVKENFESIEPEIKAPTISSNPISQSTNYNPDNYQINIDYDKLSKAVLKALNSCKLSMDKEGFIRFIQNVIYEVM